MAGQYQLTGNTNGLLPDLIIKILSRLPVKSLCRFRCVSKPWRSLISDRYFVKVHLNKAFENEHVLHQRRRVIFTDAENKSLRSLELDEFLNHDDDLHDHEHDGFVTATELAFVTDSLQRDLSVSLMSYCNGLLLCQLHGLELYLVNPATRELKILPRTPRPYRYVHLCGFGFDYSTNEHKVVCGQIIDKHGIEFCVYTLETNSWRVIRDDSNWYIPNSRRGFHLNGNLHWSMWMNKIDPYRPDIIVSLRLAKDEVRAIPLPLEFSSAGNGFVIDLGVFREWLCITQSYGEQPYNEFWVMKEYGVGESWTKMRVSIPYETLSHSGFWTKSHDLMVLDERLVMYNFNDESFKNLSIRGIEKVGSVEIYFDSLVSLVRNRPKKSSKKGVVKWQRRVKKM